MVVDDEVDIITVIKHLLQVKTKEEREQTEMTSKTKVKVKSLLDCNTGTRFRALCWLYSFYT